MYVSVCVLPWRKCCGQVLPWCKGGKVRQSLSASVKIDWRHCLAWSGTPTEHRNWTVYTTITPNIVFKKGFVMFIVSQSQKIDREWFWKCAAAWENSSCWEICMRLNGKEVYSIILMWTILMVTVVADQHLTHNMTFPYKETHTLWGKSSTRSMNVY